MYVYTYFFFWWWKHGAMFFSLLLAISCIHMLVVMTPKVLWGKQAALRSKQAGIVSFHGGKYSLSHLQTNTSEAAGPFRRAWLQSRWNICSSCQQVDFSYSALCGGRRPLDSAFSEGPKPRGCYSCPRWSSWTQRWPRCRTCEGRSPSAAGRPTGPGSGWGRPCGWQWGKSYSPGGCPCRGLRTVQFGCIGGRILGRKSSWSWEPGERSGWGMEVGVGGGGSEWVREEQTRNIKCVQRYKIVSQIATNGKQEMNSGTDFQTVCGKRPDAASATTGYISFHYLFTKSYPPTNKAPDAKHSLVSQYNGCNLTQQQTLHMLSFKHLQKAQRSEWLSV